MNERVAHLPALPFMLSCLPMSIVPCCLSLNFPSKYYAVLHVISFKEIFRRLLLKDYPYKTVTSMPCDAGAKLS